MNCDIGSVTIEEKPYCSFCGSEILETSKALQRNPRATYIPFPSHCTLVHKDCYHKWQPYIGDDELYTRCYLCANYVLKLNALYSADVPYHTFCYIEKMRFFFHDKDEQS